jgi:hypothetical protein
VHRFIVRLFDELERKTATIHLLASAARNDGFKLFLHRRKDKSIRIRRDVLIDDANSLPIDGPVSESTFPPAEAQTDTSGERYVSNRSGNEETDSRTSFRRYDGDRMVAQDEARIWRCDQDLP